MKFSLAAVVAAVAFSASAQAQSVPSEIAALSSQFSGILNGGGLPTGAALQSDIGVLTSALANPTVSSYVFNNPSLSALAQGALALAGAGGASGSSAAESSASATSGAASSAASATSAASSGASSVASGASGAASSIESKASSAVSAATGAASSAAAGGSSGAEGLSSFRGSLAPVAVVVGIVAGAVAVL
ncbi:hypothetical protein JCM3774_005353 [Rhodotorula dairenensis]